MRKIIAMTIAQEHQIKINSRVALKIAKLLFVFCLFFFSRCKQTLQFELHTFHTIELYYYHNNDMQNPRWNNNIIINIKWEKKKKL